MKDIIEEFLKKNNIPATRENYVALNTMGDSDGSEHLGAENEAEMPEGLQDNSNQEDNDNG
jgi:hypothetical protein